MDDPYKIITTILLAILVGGSFATTANLSSISVYLHNIERMTVLQCKSTVPADDQYKCY